LARHHAVVVASLLIGVVAYRTTKAKGAVVHFLTWFIATGAVIALRSGSGAGRKTEVPEELQATDLLS